MDDPEFLSNLEQLKSTNQEIFSENCDMVIKILLAVQHIKTKQPFTSIFGNNLTESLDYTLNKLVTGVLCTNPEIQMNYAICFTQILRKFGQQIDVQSLMTFILAKSNKSQAINKTEVKFFLIGKLYLFKSLIIAEQVTQFTDLDQIYDNIFEDLENNSWLSDLVLDCVESSLTDPTNIKLKIKSLINKGKFLQTEHNFTNIQYLLILDKACNQNNIQFALESQIKDRIANFKNLQKSINIEIKNFPNVNRGIHYTVEYVKRSNIQFSKDLFIYLLGNNSENYKGFFIILNFLKSFLKGSSTSELQYILIEELWHLWMKNLNVKNQFLKGVSREIMEKLNKKCQNDMESALGMEFLQILRVKPSSFRFTVKNPLAQNLIKKLLPDQLVEYFKFLKKHLHNCTVPNERSFYLSEIYVFAEISFGQLSQHTFDDICFLIFEEASVNKLTLVYQKFSADEKMEQTQEQYIEANREIIFGYFYSLLQLMIQYTPPAYVEKKNILYKGMDGNNCSKLLKLIQIFQEKKQDFSKDSKLYNSLGQLDEYVIFCKKIEKDVKKVLDETQSLESQQGGISLKKKLAFNNLMTGICIQALIFPEEMFQALQEMKILYKQMQLYYDEGVDKSTKKRKTNSNKSVQSQDKQFINVLVDIMISLLTKSACKIPNPTPTPYLKTIINVCFLQFVIEIDSSSLNTLVISLIRTNADYQQDEEEGMDEEKEEEKQEDI